MRIIRTKPLIEFSKKHPQAQQPLRVWVKEAKNTTWQTPHDVKLFYRSADIIADNRIIFNISGNKYRLIVKINYNCSVVYVKFIGTHAEYDKINAETVDAY